ncbi:biotin transporter BioY [Aerococcus suis]|uniref:Biotin transporter n=1 Tax=Aerococcus suis TaxID=371602 RepID=A0A1W1ZF30_9LACT|nr:biotin transporter BioY [Aerococcus suis]SMC47079.1 biotin transport system substrate-specific component [Aerococcus suis]
MTTKRFVLLAFLLALLIICAQLTIPILTIPITLQSFAIMMIGLVTRPTEALIVTITYVFIGLLGFPVFAGGSGGFQILLSPSFGFLMSFPLMSVAISSCHHQRPHQLWLSLLCGVAINLTIGWLYFMGYTWWQTGHPVTFLTAFQVTVLPFLPGEGLKLWLAHFVYQRLLHSVRTFHDF